MSLQERDNLTQHLAAIGVPNQYPELKLSRLENLLYFGRAYIGRMVVSDHVSTPYGRDLYERCATDDSETVVTFDETGEKARQAPPLPGFIYAIVHSPTGSLFWQRLEQAVDLRGEGRDLILSETFIATYGAPEGSTVVPESTEQQLSGIPPESEA